MILKREIHKTNPTEDGWELPLIRYKPEKSAKIPVILCHGLAANKNSVDFGDFETTEWYKYSLASYLSVEKTNGKKSFDCWVAQLRGRGHNPTFNPKINHDKYKWCVDDYIDKDIPTIIDYVQNWYKINKNYIPKIFWIGKSMGGMIAYGYLQTKEGRKNLQGLITIGSPTAFKYNSIFLEPIARLAPRKIAFPINVSEFLETNSVFKKTLKKNIANKDNIDPLILEKYIYIGMNNTISSKVLNQFLLFYRHNTYCRYPKNPWLFDLFGKVPFINKLFSPYSYKKNMNKIKTPLLALAGSDDKAAEPREIKYSICNVNSNDISYINFSKEAGFRNNYGHLDLNLGLNANIEVYPIIYNWLESRSELD